ncbi:MAG: 4-hydroxy-tetrahydrodipicolinate synthase [Vulcanimicrobiaceae bacterium]
MDARARAPLGPLLTAMLTPFGTDGAIDHGAAAHLARFLVDEGNTGLVVCGTTGESPTLETDEKVALFATVKEAVGDRAAIVAGTGGNNTRHSVALTERAEAVGVDAILAVVPYYNKPTQDGMLRHFGAMADATALPIVLYNIPGRTGANMLPATVLELARRHANIAGVKESSGDVAQFAAILRERPAGFGFWAGDDHMLLPALALGGDGLISVAAHLAAREYRDLIDAFARGENARAAELYLALSPLVAALFATSSPIPIKWALRELGFALGECRSPLGTMPPDLAERLRPLLDPFRARTRATHAALR